MSYFHLTQLQSGDDAEPLILIHALTGTVVPYQHLVKFLPLQRAIYGIEAAGLDGKVLPFEHIRTIAAYYAAELKIKFAHKRLFIIGWSFGGVIAAEVTALLTLSGHDAQAALLDTQCLNSERKTPVLPNEEVLLEFAGTLINDTNSGQLPTLEQLKTLPEKSQFPFILDLLMNTRRMTSPELIRNMYRVFYANLRAHDRYLPTPIPNVDAIFIKSKKQTHPNADDSLGWKKIFGDSLKTVVIPGNHYSILNPYFVSTTAQNINEWSSYKRAC